MDRFAVQTDQFRDQFIGILSHDLRTPLGAITASAALIALPEDSPQRRSRVVARVMTRAQRMERMIADLLDVSGPDWVDRFRSSGAAPLQLVCEEAVIELRANKPDAVVRLEASGDLRGEWDHDRLTQVVSNLIGDSVTLAVHNGGPPIPPEVLPSVFEPLACGHEETGGRSIGLGLFIARAIVSAHRGDILARSCAESGTVFTVTLPKR